MGIDFTFKSYLESAQIIINELQARNYNDLLQKAHYEPYPDYRDEWEDEYKNRVIVPWELPVFKDLDLHYSDYISTQYDSSIGKTRFSVENKNLYCARMVKMAERFCKPDYKNEWITVHRITTSSDVQKHWSGYFLSYLPDDLKTQIVETPQAYNPIPMDVKIYSKDYIIQRYNLIQNFRYCWGNKIAYYDNGAFSKTLWENYTLSGRSTKQYVSAYFASPYPATILCKDDSYGSSSGWICIDCNNYDDDAGQYFSDDISNFCREYSRNKFEIKIHAIVYDIKDYIIANGGTVRED